MELIIDIETVSEKNSYEVLDESLRAHWEHKANILKLSDEERDTPSKSYFNRAGIYAEFGKIICIGLGFIDREKQQIRIKSLHQHDERELLTSFLSLIQKLEQEHKASIVFCGHNIKEFDLPYICRRALVHGLSLPSSLKLSGLRPWQNPHQDTLELWRFGDFKHYTSLDLLAHVLGIPSSKTDIDGSEVNRVYWLENNLERIAQYCSRDIYTTALVYLKLAHQDAGTYEAVYV